MCGIVGIASVGPIASRDELRRATLSLAHRGPDDAGEWWSADGRVGLGHRRLSVIDLSAGAHQPMIDSENSLSVVFNGELYNYRELRRELVADGRRFRTESDTEVLLAAYNKWGAACLSHLVGMFAFGLFDGLRQQLFMARDRAGEKPLFYTLEDDRTLRFASELRALIINPVLPRRIDLVGLDCYLAMGYVPGERCILHGTSKLPPAHALRFELGTGKLETWRYWRAPELVADDTPASADETVLDNLETTLAEAVQRELVADVPVGVLLSGGVDSSLVTAMATRAARSVKTFTVRFPGHPRYDETAHARLVARHFGTDHVELDAGQAPVAILSTFARQIGEPLADASLVPTYVLSQLVREHCTVALGGDGGDELFGGYRPYSRMLRLQTLSGWIPRAARGAVGRTAASLLPVGLRARNWFQSLNTDFNRDVPATSTLFDAGMRQRLMQDHSGWSLAADQIRAERIPSTGDLLQRATRLDFENYLPDDILVKVDRASMAHSLEVRAPFLDRDVIEFAFARVPSRLKANRGSRKILLRRLCTRVLPSGFDQTRKQGFSPPLASWLALGPWRAYLRQILLEDGDGLFDRGTVRTLFDRHGSGVDHSGRLFALAMMELWRREFDATI